MTDIVVIGAGPAGAVAALRAADLGARTTLVTSSGFGGMAANDGPVPVRTLAHAARLIRGVRQLGQYGIAVGEPVLDYSRLLARVRGVVSEVLAHSSLREQIDSAGVTIHERAGAARFADPHTIVTETGLRLQADKMIICVGGVGRRLPIPGFEFTSTHSSAFSLTEVPPTMLVIGGGATGVQVASIFNAFGSRVELFETGPRILSGEDEDIAAAVATAFREAGIVVHENFGSIDSFEKTSAGVQMNFSKNSERDSAEATLAVVAAGWVANTAELNLGGLGVLTDHRGFVKVDDYLRTSVPNIFAAGDVTGRLMLVPPALQQGFVASTNAVLGPTVRLEESVNTSAGFTHPEYASAGLTETKARETHDVVTAVIHFDSTIRTIIDGRKVGFCKLIVDRKTAKILGCHVAGERAVEIAQVAAIAISAGLRVDDLARVPLAFPTYTGNLADAAASAARQLELHVGCQAPENAMSR
ncbi:dihydrolipoyl dehydrogenase family protein [Mesorhizobium ventifaucium]|uniref:Dihydrolipoyl dehydrogenase n=1 Tax=Mesorhizobium ventifaucium TaxID=666020 RepID=A0ABN8JT31_9HYPH|nr:NAD(P)/FAD-dependent oxidoreductase [Mesorhizobium ventifaucium]CAH2400460.1 putative Dihydrolipoyl dehydrogenase [Mesorhizobium ventifaucium]